MLKRKISYLFLPLISLAMLSINCGEATKELNKCESKCDLEFSLCFIVLGNKYISTSTEYLSSSGAATEGGIVTKTTSTIDPVGVYLCYKMNETCKGSCYKSSSSSTTRTTSSSSRSSSSSSGGGGSASGGGSGGS